MRVISMIYAILIVIDITDIHVRVRGSSEIGQGLQVSQGESGECNRIASSTSLVQVYVWRRLSVFHGNERIGSLYKALRNSRYIEDIRGNTRIFAEKICS